LLARKNGRVLEMQAETFTRKYYCISVWYERQSRVSHLFYAPPNPKLTMASTAALDMLKCMPTDGRTE